MDHRRGRKIGADARDKVAAVAFLLRARMNDASAEDAVLVSHMLERSQEARPDVRRARNALPRMSIVR